MRLKPLGSLSCNGSLAWKSNEKAPLLGVVSRLTYQKGLDMLLECLPKLLDGGAQMIVLGSGEVDLERRYQQLAQRYPGTSRSPFASTRDCRIGSWRVPIFS